MIKKYIFNGTTYDSELLLRQDLSEKDPESGEEMMIAVPAVSGDPVKFWAQFGVVYSEEPDSIPVQIKNLEDGVQKYMDSVANERGYDSIYTAIGYSNSTVVRFKEDAEAAIRWRDEIWVKCHQLLEQYEKGEIEALTLSEVIERLPKISWSETEEYFE